MYKIIGADKNEYGPVSFEQMRQWIAQGRVRATTLVQFVGHTEWKSASEFPEFAAAFHPPPFTPPPLSPFRQADEFAPEILRRDYHIDIGDCLGRAWRLMQTDFWPIIGVSALITLILSASGAAYVGFLLTGPLVGGLYFYYLKKIRGQTSRLEDAFSGFTLAFVQLFLASLVSSLLVSVGLLFCIVPGIYFAVAWQFSLPLVIDRRIEFWPAMELSRKVISKHWWTFLGFAIVMGLVNVVGLLCCCIGLFVTVPLTMIALAYAYEDIFRAPLAPPAPPL